MWLFLEAAVWPSVRECRVYSRRQLKSNRVFWYPGLNEADERLWPKRMVDYLTHKTLTAAHAPAFLSDIQPCNRVIIAVSK